MVIANIDSLYLSLALPPFSSEQLHRCIDQISDLNAQKLSLEGQVTHHQEEGKMASIGLVKTQLTKVKVEISSEEEVKAKLEVRGVVTEECE